MKMRIQREPLLKGCRLAERALPQRQVEPAGRLLLQAAEGTCTLQVAGHEVGLRLELPAVVEEAGDVLLPTRQALSVVREAAAEELSLESAAGRVRAWVEGAEFVLETAGMDRPAVIGPFPAGARHQTPPDLLGQAIRRVLVAVGDASPRYSLHSVLWEMEPDQVRLVATDNRRLAVAEVPAQNGDEQRSQQRLLPVRALDLLARLCDDAGDPVQVHFAERHAFFQVGPAILCARLVRGAYPDWRRALPSSPRHLLPLPVGPFFCGVRQAMAVRETPAARMLFRFEPGWVQMFSRKAGTGQARVQLPLPLAGGRVAIAFNPLLLVELLRLFDDDDLLLLGLTSPTAPAVFSDGYAYTHVLSPCLDAGYRRQTGLTTPG